MFGKENSSKHQTSFFVSERFRLELHDRKKLNPYIDSNFRKVYKEFPKNTITDDLIRKSLKNVSQAALQVNFKFLINIYTFTLIALFLF